MVTQAIVDDVVHGPESLTGRGMVLFDRGRARRLMEDAGIDVLMPHTQINAGYLADYYFSNIIYWPFYMTEMGLPYLGFVGFPANPALEPFILGSTSGNAMDIGYFDPWIKDRYLFGNAEPRDVRVEPSRTTRPVSDNAIEATVRALSDRGLSKGTIGVELLFLGAAVLQRLQEALPEATFVDGLGVLTAMRMIKTPEEIRRMEVAADLTRQAHLAVNAELRAGLTGIDVDLIIRRSIAALGVDMDFREIHPNRDRAVMFAPTDGVLKPHEAISIDLGVKYLNYGSDMAHNHSLGAPEPATAELHRGMKEAFLVTMETAKPGVACSTVYEATKRELDRQRVPMLYNMVGHGLGRHVHEAPVLTADDQTPIEVGMVFAFELPMWTKEAGWVQMEENFVIEEDGPRWLTPWTLDILLVD